MQLQRGGGLADGLVGIGVLRQGDKGAVGPQDAGFFAGDLGDGVAQVVLMVERDVGDDGDQRVDDVGGVEASAKADLEDGNINGLLGEVEERERGQCLEEAGRVGQVAGADQPFGGGVDLEVEPREVVVGDGGAVDLDALVDAGEVGRGVETLCGSPPPSGCWRAWRRWSPCRWFRRSGSTGRSSAGRRERGRGGACVRGRTCGAAPQARWGPAQGPSRRDGRAPLCRTWGYFRR